MKLHSIVDELNCQGIWQLSVNSSAMRYRDLIESKDGEVLTQDEALREYDKIQRENEKDEREEASYKN